MQEITEDMKALIGRQIQMNRQERTLTIGGMKRHVVSSSIDPHDPLVNKMKSMAQSVRLITPSTVCTQDIRRDRLNFHIDQYGTIQRVYYG